MKNSISLFLFMSFSLTLIGQNEHLAEIKSAWQSYKTALVNKEYVKVVALTHPSVIKKSGGENYFIDDLLLDLGMFESQGLKVKELIAKNPSAIIKTKNNELQGMMPYERVFVSNDTEIIEQQYMLITSFDEGKSWFFFDLSKQDSESIALFVPNYDERLDVFLEDKK